ncbi:PHD finger protein 20-like protein 1 isoform X2 [Centroberyx gerrardi]|uniref:PHD finger protein 20-like protein 1 isoform X2 n=1 Tax=Centroberyx gerrardi TaxID=166262 RepID=UPI003AABBCE8
MSNKPPTRPGISFEVGAKVEAQDYLKKWYPARIEQLEPEEGRLLVHFDRWSHRYDEWISWDSGRLRPLDRPAICREPLQEEDHSAELQDGEEVLARWTDCRYYPAKIEAVNKEGTYRVQFYDGVVRCVKRIHIKSMPEDAKGQDWVALVKAATAAWSGNSSKPRTSNNSSRCRREAQGEEQQVDEEETEEEGEEEEEREGGEEEQKEPCPIQIYDYCKPQPMVCACPYQEESSPAVDPSVNAVSPAGEEPQSASETSPSAGTEKKNNHSAHPCSQRRRSQRLATGSDLTSDLSNPELCPSHPSPSPPQDEAAETETSVHHSCCAGVLPTMLAQPTAEWNSLTDNASTNHTAPEEKSPPLSTAVGMKNSASRTPKSNKHAREPIMSSLHGPGPPSSTSEEPSQFQCFLPGCSKAFRKAKLLDYHLKYYHSTSAGQAQANTTPPVRVGRTRATSTSLPPSSNASAPELQDGKRRRTVSSCSSLFPQIFQVEAVRATARSGKKKRSSASVSSDSTEVSSLTPIPQPSLVLPPLSPPRELRLETPYHSLLRSPLEPGFIKMEKRIKMEEKHISIGRRERREQRESDPFKVKLKKKKKKKKSKQHCYHDYGDLSLSFMERTSLHHHYGNSFSFLPSSSSSSKHLLYPRAILQVDLTGENLSEGEYLEDSTTESLPYSGEELELEENGPAEDLSEASQEIVRCICQMDEENGFMIQCEECMCWQHSVCMGLLEESIPDQYICYICRDPPGQRWSAKYLHNRDWLMKGHMFGLSILSENYSKQNSQRIVSTHQLLADLLTLKHILHGLMLKMDILQDRHSPSLQLWARSWVNSDEHQPMGGLPDCLHLLDHMHSSCLASPPHSSLLHLYASSPSDPPLSDTYITSEHSYQKPVDPGDNLDTELCCNPNPHSSPRLHKGPATDSASCSIQQAKPVVVISCPLEASRTPGDPSDSSRNPISPESPEQAEHQARTRTRTCVQWQMNLLTHIEDVQNQLASRMDFIEKELDVLESWLDLSGGLEHPDTLACLPQLKLSIKQLLADLSKLQDISTLCAI